MIEFFVWYFFALSLLPTKEKIRNPKEMAKILLYIKLIKNVWASTKFSGQSLLPILLGDWDKNIFRRK